MDSNSVVIIPYARVDRVCVIAGRLSFFVSLAHLEPSKVAKRHTQKKDVCVVGVGVWTLASQQRLGHVCVSVGKLWFPRGTHTSSSSLP